MSKAKERTPSDYFDFMSDSKESQLKKLEYYFGLADFLGKSKFTKVTRVEIYLGFDKAMENAIL